MPRLQTGGRNQYAFHHLFNKNAHKSFFALIALSGIADEDGIIFLRSSFFNTASHFSEEWIGYIWHNQT